MARSSTTLKKGDKIAEKWTEQEAIKLAEELLAWIKEPDHTFYEDFLCVENDYYPELISYLSNKFSPFLNLIKRAKKIQEMKLIKLGISDKVATTMSIFCLKNHHDYKDRKDHNINATIESDLSGLSTEELLKRAEAMRIIESEKGE